VKRRLLNALAVLSLILSLVTAVLWVRSYWVVDGLYNEGVVDDKECGIMSFRGRVIIQSLGRDDSWPGIRGWEWVIQRPDDDDLRPLLNPKRRFAGFDYIQWGHRKGRYVLISFPHSSLLALCLVIPTVRCAPRPSPGPALPDLRLRPPRHAGSLPRVRPRPDLSRPAAFSSGMLS
jgi:hypothetical protein